MGEERDEQGKWREERNGSGLWLVDEKGELREEREGNETNKVSVWEQLI